MIFLSASAEFCSLNGKRCTSSSSPQLVSCALLKLSGRLPHVRRSRERYRACSIAHFDSCVRCCKTRIIYCLFTPFFQNSPLRRFVEIFQVVLNISDASCRDVFQLWIAVSGVKSTIAERICALQYVTSIFVDPRKVLRNVRWSWSFAFSFEDS